MERRQLVVSLAFLSISVCALSLFVLKLITINLLLLIATVFLVLLALINQRHKTRMAEIIVATQNSSEKLNLLCSKLKAKERLLQNLPNQIERLNFFNIFIDKIIKCDNVDEVYHIITNDLMTFFEDIDTILIYLHRRGDLYLEYSFKRDEYVGKPIKQKKGDMLDLWVLKQNKELLIENIHDDFRFDNSKIKSLKERPIVSLLSSPMFLGRKTIGILRVESFGVKVFTYDDLRILSVISNIAALAIDRLSVFERVQDLAVKDSLTGLFLKGYFMDRLKQEITRASANKQEFSIIMVDIDHFKKINDKYGHVAGDIVLKKLARIFKLHR